jgi:hypothetical protein
MFPATSLKRGTAVALAAVPLAILVPTTAVAASGHHSAPCSTSAIAHGAKSYLTHHDTKKQVSEETLRSYGCADGYAIAGVMKGDEGTSEIAITFRADNDVWHGMHSGQQFGSGHRGGVPKKAFKRLEKAPLHGVDRRL